MPGSNTNSVNPLVRPEEEENKIDPITGDVQQPVTSEPKKVLTQQDFDPYAPYKGTSWEDMMAYMQAHTESDEQRKERERRERTQNLVYSLADMGRALGNLYHTTQYAPNGYDPTKSMSDTARARYDAATAQRNKDRDWHLNYAIRQAGMKQGDKQFNFAVAKQRRADEESARQFDEELALKERLAEQAAEQFERVQGDKENYHREMVAVASTRAANSGKGGSGSGGSVGRGKADYEELSIGGGSKLRIPKTALGSAVSKTWNVNKVYNKIPASKRPQATYNSKGVLVEPTTEKKIQAILDNMDNADVANEMTRLGWEVVSGTESGGGNVGKKANPMGNGKRANPMK